jgi:hypothetical protein
MEQMILRGIVPDGYGYGYGYGYGNGYGNGNGDGNGYGNGDCYGYGYGDCYGYGYGNGDGNGDGCGYGDGSYWSQCIPSFVAKMGIVQRERFATLQQTDVRFAYWRSNENGLPANGGKGTKAEPGVIHKESGPLRLCERGTLHATLIPPKWKGERWWIVALHGEVIGDDEKFGCLEREIIGECL